MRFTEFTLLTAIALAAGAGCASLRGIIYGGIHAPCGEVGCDTCGETGYESYEADTHDGHGHASCESCESSGIGTERAMAGMGLLGNRASFLRPRGCRNCGEALPPPAGPPTGAVTYPYYTTRGPRDFLSDNPPSIGR